MPCQSPEGTGQLVVHFGRFTDVPNQRVEDLEKEKGFWVFPNGQIYCVPTSSLNRKMLWRSSWCEKWVISQRQLRTI
jgi:hypothetical protein